ncbi:MAG: ribosomal L7Ae/L30e/S12e/Gadd45 family protein [Nitrososphaerota archaeon]|nr:ribosomal L7Ae/L30e/S12e/Gadd45 family protein [Nitrososphaerota archaeon]MDG6965469.1 ribosomal L7Ae/L30e/S12e/Gadd45 family protein [Nitrososphaerota archaeon]MDG6969036.1 ribosomal L7Ae/L30e/S12e/Gadd45 family protein [Nitrososphaerota archaeon]MDG6972084.1 ribosomal L7Ae/L30e/S12e/Gadd45 family protein [Nitrososphaerota archaeon]MDG6976207.1 ribosomal L7Ae/L30e/S12e/Gadd45 family protein [Nitrososphaerota archaeon]
MDSAQLSKVIKDAMKAGKTALGAKESIAAVKGSKGILITRSIPTGLGDKLREEAKKNGVPIVELTQTSAELARLVGRPYKVSAMALRNVSDTDVKQLMR